MAGELEKKIDRILYILEGDDAINREGLVEKVDKTAERVSKIESDVKMVKTSAGVVAFIISAVWAVAQFLLKVLL